jgi:hypothetical protein
MRWLVTASEEGRVAAEALISLGKLIAAELPLLDQCEDLGRLSVG